MIDYIKFIIADAARAISGVCKGLGKGLLWVALIVALIIMYKNGWFMLEG